MSNTFKLSPTYLSIGGETFFSRISLPLRPSIYGPVWNVHAGSVLSEMRGIS